MLIITTLILWLLLHPVHVTNTSVDYSADAGEIAVFVMLYYDDFLLDYMAFDAIIDTDKYDKSFPEEMMARYINNRLTVVIDDEKLDGTLINMSLGDNEMRVNLVYKTEKKFKKLTVNNSFLADLYDDQANMTIVKVGNYEEGVKFTSQFREKSFSVN